MNKKNILLVCLIIVTAIVIIGGVHYNKSVQAEKMNKTGEKLDETETIKLMVEGLFKDNRKEELADNITGEQVKDALKKVENLPNNLVNAKLVKDVNTANLFYETELTLTSLLTNGILSDDLEQSQIKVATKALKKVEPLSQTLYKKLNGIVIEVNAQFNYNQEIIKLLMTFFEESNDEKVKDDVTREQYEMIKKQVRAIKNKKIKKEQEKRLDSIEEHLIEQEEKELEESLLLEEEINKESEGEAQNNSEEENNSTINSQEDQNTWVPVSPKPTKPWKPSTSDNSKPKPKPNVEVKPTVPEKNPDTKPIEPDDSSDTSENENQGSNQDPDKESIPEPEPEPELEPGLDSSSGSEKF